MRLALRGLMLGAALLVAAAAAAGAAPPKTKPAKPAPAPGASAPKPAAAAPALHFQPKARRMSTYVLQGHFEMTTRDITFDAPEAYKDGFDYWAGQMRGHRRSEIFLINTMTEEADEQGMVAFRRTIPRFDVEIQKKGQILTAPPTLEKTVAALLYEGKLDPLGNVREIRMSAGNPDDPEIQGLSIPEMTSVFPKIDAPLDLRIGEAFKETRVVRLPTKLNIAGLENTTLTINREYTLRSTDAGVASFDVKTTYADDPAFKPGLERTTIRISGGGDGKASFEIPRGVFQDSRLPTSMHIEIEAPLRPLPNHPETNVSTTLGRSHIDLDILLSGQQTVRRIWGEEQD